MTNKDVSKFLDNHNHPLRADIEELRTIILASVPELHENIKWNGPNYSLGLKDLITMRIQPPKHIQLIFHRGAKKQQQPAERLIDDQFGILTWKENDRAVATFKNLADIESRKKTLSEIVSKWINAAK